MIRMKKNQTTQTKPKNEEGGCWDKNKAWDSSFNLKIELSIQCLKELNMESEVSEDEDEVAEEESNLLLFFLFFFWLLSSSSPSCCFWVVEEEVDLRDDFIGFIDLWFELVERGIVKEDDEKEESWSFWRWDDGKRGKGSFPKTLPSSTSKFISSSNGTLKEEKCKNKEKIRLMGNLFDAKISFHPTFFQSISLFLLTHFSVVHLLAKIVRVRTSIPINLIKSSKDRLVPNPYLPTSIKMMKLIMKN